MQFDRACHPDAPHAKLHAPDWFVSRLMLDRALDAILRRVKKLDRSHDIPYLAGYSMDGTTIYIDRHLPFCFTYRGREIDVDRFLIMHEEVEKTLIDQLGLHYLHAHQIATRAEEAAVRAERISWHAYDKFMQKYVKRIGDERLQKVPKDLDLKPYRDYHDWELLQRMQQAIDTGKLPKPSPTLCKELAAYASAFREQHRDEARTAKRAPAKKSASARVGAARPRSRTR